MQNLQRLYILIASSERKTLGIQRPKICSFWIIS